MTKQNNNRPDRGKNKKAGNVSTKVRPEEERAKLAKQLGLKRRTKEFVDEIINNKTISNTQAYINTHETNSRKTASIEASKLLKKPSVQAYSNQAVGRAKRRIVTLVDSNNESIALKASESIIDRVEGKAIQRSESLNRTVEVKLDLSGVRIGAHHVISANNTPIEENT